LRESNKIRTEKDAKRLDLELSADAALIADAVEGLKGINLLVLNVRGLANFTDFLVICSGSSNRHVKALVDGIKVKLRAANVTPLHTEGYEEGAWVLIDFVDCLVNVFTHETRRFYQLERVWRDAPVLLGERAELPPEGQAVEEPATEPEGIPTGSSGA
jgi:ribosome-associated protein|tara:strand:- start:292 stop:768 length:477 start_codon:yes stop_codon:yes gene_type:complete